MSDEESFVILGTSPVASLTEEVFSTINENALNGLSQNNSMSNKKINNSMNTSSSSNSMTSNFSIIQKLTKLNKSENNASVPSVPNYLHHSQSLQLDNDNSNSVKLAEEINSIEMNGSVKNDANASSSSLAAVHYILGEIEPDVLKESIYSQFPSTSSNDTNPEDINKFHRLMHEYVQLKETVCKNNATIKKFFKTDEKRQIDLKRMVEGYQTKMTGLEQTISKLRNENLELKSELESRMNQITLNEQIMRKENNDLVKLVSEKSALIENMRAQIEKLEKKDLTIFEYVEKSGTNINEHEYVPMYEYKAIVSDLNGKISSLVADNQDIKNMQAGYIDQIDGLKKHVLILEETLQREKDDMSILKRDKFDKESVIESYVKKIENLQQEVNILTMQVDLYRKDFEIEKAEREALAVEKHQLLSDLKILHKKNQQMIEETESRLKQQMKLQQELQQSKLSSPANPNPSEETGYFCPLCNTSFKSLNVLQNHVQLCLND